jgi:hypothetical protein
LIPFALETPSAEALMVLIVAREVAVLNESFLKVITVEINLFVKTHVVGDSDAYIFGNQTIEQHLRSAFRIQSHGVTYIEIRRSVTRWSACPSIAVAVPITAWWCTKAKDTMEMDLGNTVDESQRYIRVPLYSIGRQAFTAPARRNKH